MLTRLASRHLDDTAFAEIWTNAAAEGSDQPSHPHLEACAECRVRFASFATWLEELRTDAIDEADEVFTAERLNAQQAHVLRRLEAAERPTRIIAFPKTAAAAARPSPVRRWIAASAAAGLIVGVALGQLMDLRHMSTPPSSGVPSDRLAEAGRGPLPGVAIQTVAFSEEAALAEIEDASAPRYESLRPYDTFTPRAADMINPR